MGNNLTKQEIIKQLETNSQVTYEKRNNSTGQVELRKLLNLAIIPWEPWSESFKQALMRESDKTLLEDLRLSNKNLEEK